MVKGPYCVLLARPVYVYEDAVRPVAMETPLRSTEYVAVIPLYVIPDIGICPSAFNEPKDAVLMYGRRGAVYRLHNPPEKKVNDIKSRAAQICIIFVLSFLFIST
jgi:hypothetical protein